MKFNDIAVHTIVILVIYDDCCEFVGDSLSCPAMREYYVLWVVITVMILPRTISLSLFEWPTHIRHNCMYIIHSENKRHKTYNF